MDDPLNPRIFLVLAVGNLITAVLMLVGSIDLFSMGRDGSDSHFALLFLSGSFIGIGGLAGQQYQTMRAVNEKFRKLQESIARGEELVAK